MPGRIQGWLLNVCLAETLVEICLLYMTRQRDFNLRQEFVRLKRLDDAHLTTLLSVNLFRVSNLHWWFMGTTKQQIPSSANPLDMLELGEAYGHVSSDPAAAASQTSLSQVGVGDTLDAAQTCTTFGSALGGKEQPSQSQSQVNSQVQSQAQQAKAEAVASAAVSTMDRDQRAIQSFVLDRHRSQSR